jgi:hypothetical protein
MYDENLPVKYNNKCRLRKQENHIGTRTERVCVDTPHPINSEGIEKLEARRGAEGCAN